MRAFSLRFSNKKQRKNRNVLELAIENGQSEIIHIIFETAFIRPKWSSVLFPLRIDEEEAEKIIIIAEMHEKWDILLLIFHCWKKLGNIRQCLSLEKWKELKDVVDKELVASNCKTSKCELGKLQKIIKKCI